MEKELSQFLAYLKHERNSSVHTISSYQRDLIQFEGYLVEKNINLETVDNVVLRGFLAALYEKQQKKSTIARKLAAVRSFFQYCQKRKDIGQLKGSTHSPASPLRRA